jgi:hypothetical protein
LVPLEPTLATTPGANKGMPRDNRRMPWNLADSVAYECTLEAVTHAIGLRSAGIALEEGRAQPDRDRIGVLEVEIHQLGRARRLVDPNQPAAMHALRERLNTEIRARSSRDAGQRAA